MIWQGLAPGSSADGERSVADDAGPWAGAIEQRNRSAGDEDGEGVVLGELVFLAIMIAPDGQHVLVEEIDQLDQQPVGVVARPVEKVAQENREQVILLGVIHRPFELAEDGAGVVVFAKFGSAA